jgi:hypothetical protein
VPPPGRERSEIVSRDVGFFVAFFCRPLGRDCLRPGGLEGEEAFLGAGARRRDHPALRHMRHT